MSFFQKSGIVNVKMVITEEKILSNIDKIQKLINPNSKKQIVQLEEDSYFKDLVESVKTYLLEYPKKMNFPKGVYKAAYDLVEYTTTQFEENTKKIEELIRQREKNIKLGSVLRDSLTAVSARAKNWKEIVKKIETKYPAEISEALTLIGKTKNKEAEEYLVAVKTIETKINNLESNLHIEIDIERIEDRSKALSFIGIEIAEALKYIPVPVEDILEAEQAEAIEEKNDSTTTIKMLEENIQDEIIESQDVAEDASVEVATAQNKENEDRVSAELENYFQETRFETKPSLWQRFKNSKFVRTIKFIMQIRVVLDYPALPEGKGEN